MVGSFPSGVEGANASGWEVGGKWGAGGAVGDRSGGEAMEA